MGTNKKQIFILVFVGMLLLLPGISGFEIIPVCTAPAFQFSPAISGDTIVWEDSRNIEITGEDIYMWDPVDGERPVCVAPGDQEFPVISRDTIVWEDYRNPLTTGWDIYMWDPVHGERSICVAPRDQYGLAISGNTVVWTDCRNYNTTGRDIYMWDPVDGERPVCTAPEDQCWPVISGDTIVWEDYRNVETTSLDLYMWDSVHGERSLCTALGSQEFPAISGNTIVWEDTRNFETSGYDLYMAYLSTTPVADFSFSPEIIVIEENISFDASFSYDPYGTIVNYHWDFGDETIQDGVLVEHYYSKPGDYSVKLTIEDNDGEINSTVQTVLVKPRPVILVHGWRGSPSTWDELIDELENNGIPYYVFDYSEDDAIGNPTDYAQELEQEIKQLRDNSEKIVGLGYNGGYSGKYDVICHSMGAMVTRWYMEEMGGSENVIQWIGINPVNHGAALAEKGDPLVPDWLGFFIHGLIGTEQAVKAMKTNSPEVRTLDANDLDNGVIYRVIVGKNELKNASFHGNKKLFGFIKLGFGGKTIAMRIVNGSRKYWRTYLGDGVVAIEQSILEGKGIDCYEGLDHTATTHNATVISNVTGYLKDPSKKSMNYIPITDPEFERRFEAQGGNKGYLVKNGENTYLRTPVGKNVEEKECILDYRGSKLGMTIVSPSGQTMQQGVDPVIIFYEDEDSIYYLISQPEEGIWSIRIDAIDVPPEGEPYSFITTISGSNLPTEDAIAPATSIVLMGTLGNADLYSSNVEVTLISIDDTGGSGINSTRYSFDGTTWFTYTEPFTIDNNGETTVYYHSIDNTGNIEEKQQKIVRIDKKALLPVVNFTADPTEGIAPLTVWFNDTSSDNLTSWSWDFGDGTIATDQHPIHTYTAAGTYTVNLMVTNAYGSNEKCISDYITVREGKISITVPRDGNATIGDEFTLSGVNTDGVMTYLFLTGPGLPASGVNIVNLSKSVVSGDPSTFTVVAVEIDETWEYIWDTASVWGGTLQEGAYTVYAAPQPKELGDLGDVPYASVTIRLTSPVQPGNVSFVVDRTSGVAPLTVQFTDTSANSPTTWHWTFGDTATSTDQHPAHTYTTPGNYTVSLSLNGGADTCTRPAYIKVTPLLFGDANDDGAVNQADTLRVLKEVVGLSAKPTTDELFRKTDVHTNGVIEVGDALFIAQYNVGLRDAWFEMRA